MLFIEESIRKSVARFFTQEKGSENFPLLQFQKTRKDFEGDITLVVFPLTKVLKGKPEEVGTEIGKWLETTNELVVGYNVVKGFLNLSISDLYWLEFLNDTLPQENYGFADPGSGKTVMVEYSSPNTNKPLHLGHLRNNFLGYSISEILKANGHNVVKVQIINDRGIHICKSMVAWSKYGDGETPADSGKKGDKLVGDYYVLFDKKYKEEIKKLVEDGMEEKEAEKNAPILLEAQAMLRKWEKNDPEIRNLWKRMNGWVYDGFEVTYKKMGVDFDKLYYESDTYLLGRDEVKKGLEAGHFYQKEDGSIWVDMEAEGMDQKLLLRGDSTAVYMTQDIGTAILRFNDYPALSKIIYTVGNEQDYHFKVLFKILEKIGYEWAKNCYHLSYGMVDLPSGKMKSREGTVVDADDLMKEMANTAREISEELGKLDGIPEKERNTLYHMMGMGALKYFLLKVEPKKRLLFDPTESVDFNGNTGPFIQYTHARIKSILRKVDNNITDHVNTDISLSNIEKELVKKLHEYPSVLKEAGENYAPSHIANYLYDLVKTFNSFYQSTPILKSENKILEAFRVVISAITGRVIESGMGLLGIQVPERM